MSRLRAAGYGGVVAVVVFVYLALPTLRQLFGPIVNLPVYAGVALAAGAGTYVLVRRVYSTTRDRSSDVDKQLEELRDDL